MSGGVRKGASAVKHRRPGGPMVARPVPELVVESLVVSLAVVVLDVLPASRGETDSTGCSLYENI